MKHIKTSRSTKLAALLAGAALLGLASQSALALGTAGGTPINNTATLTYSVGGTGQPNILAASPTFVVDEKINLTVVGGVTTTAATGAMGVATPFTVTNNSNSALDFSLVVDSAIAGDQFDPALCTFAQETNAVAGYQAGVDTVITFLDEIPAAPAAGSTATVYALCNIPAALVTGNQGLIDLKATARGDFTGVAGQYAAGPGVLGAALPVLAFPSATADTAATVDLVYADIAGTFALDAANDAAHSARNIYQIANAALTVSKTAIPLCDPVNGTVNPKNIPGAAVQYAISISNAAGGASATLTQLSDAVTGTTFDANLISGAGGAAGCVAGAAGSLAPAVGVGVVGGALVLGAVPALVPAANHAATGGAAFAAGTVTITFNALASAAYAGLDTLPAGNYVTVYFNAFVP